MYSSRAMRFLLATALVVVALAAGLAPAGARPALAGSEEENRIRGGETGSTKSTLKASPRKIGVWGGYDEAPRFDQYAIDTLGLAEAHTISRGEGITVAIIDTGVQLDHPALAANLLSTGFDFVDGDSVPEDVPDGIDNDGNGQVDEALGHGTHVAGIVLLVAPASRILPIRALDADGTSEIFTVAMAVQYAVDQGADVINLSLGTAVDAGLLHYVIQQAARAGVVVVAAAGNDGTELPQYPAADVCALGVTSIDQDRQLSPQATYGPWVDLAAPGESIYSAMLPNGYGWWSGTSMATPFVSGQAALLSAVRPDAGIREIASIASLTADEIDGMSDGPDQAPHGHAINIARSLTYARDQADIPTEESPIGFGCTLPYLAEPEPATAP